jgi:hypothetical protein
MMLLWCHLVEYLLSYDAFITPLSLEQFWTGHPCHQWHHYGSSPWHQMTSSIILHYIWLFTFPFLPSSSSHTHYNMTKHLSSKHIQRVLTLLDKHTPYCQIQAQTHVGLATVFHIRAEHHSELPSSIGGHPNLLSPADQRHAIRLVTGTVRDKTDQVFCTFHLISHFSANDCLIVLIQPVIAAHQSWLLNDVTMMSFAPLVVELWPYLSTTLTRSVLSPSFLISVIAFWLLLR